MRNRLTFASDRARVDCDNANRALASARRCAPGSRSRGTFVTIARTYWTFALVHESMLRRQIALQVRDYTRGWLAPDAPVLFLDVPEDR